MFEQVLTIVLTAVIVALWFEVKTLKDKHEDKNNEC